MLQLRGGEQISSTKQMLEPELKMLQKLKNNNLEELLYIPNYIFILPTGDMA